MFGHKLKIIAQIVLTAFSLQSLTPAWGGNHLSRTRNPEEIPAGDAVSEITAYELADFSENQVPGLAENEGRVADPNPEFLQVRNSSDRESRFSDALKLQNRRSPLSLIFSNRKILRAIRLSLMLGSELWILATCGKLIRSKIVSSTAQSDVDQLSSNLISQAISLAAECRNTTFWAENCDSNALDPLTCQTSMSYLTVNSTDQVDWNVTDCGEWQLIRTPTTSVSGKSAQAAADITILLAQCPNFGDYTTFSQTPDAIRCHQDESQISELHNELPIIILVLSIGCLALLVSSCAVLDLDFHFFTAD